MARLLRFPAGAPWALTLTDPAGPPRGARPGPRGSHAPSGRGSSCRQGQPRAPARPPGEVTAVAGHAVSPARPPGREVQPAPQGGLGPPFKSPSAARPPPGRPARRPLAPSPATPKTRGPGSDCLQHSAHNIRLRTSGVSVARFCGISHPWPLWAPPSGEEISILKASLAAPKPHLIQGSEAWRCEVFGPSDTAGEAGLLTPLLTPCPSGRAGGPLIQPTAQV